MVSESDGTLVRVTLSGRREAYEELVRRYSARIYAICWARTRGRETAADMTQEAFLRGFRALATLADPEKFGSWLSGIAVRACLDWRKDRERSQVSLSTLDSDAGPDELLPGRLPDPSGLEADEKRRRILDEVQALPEIYREAVTLFYFENRSYAQMQEVLGIGPQAINARLMKARALLRDKLKSVNT